MQPGESRFNRSDHPATRPSELYRRFEVKQRRLATFGLLSFTLVCGLTAVLGGLLPGLGGLISFAALVILVALVSFLLVRGRWIEANLRSSYDMAAQNSLPPPGASLPVVNDMSGWKAAEVVGYVPSFRGITGSTYGPADQMECLVDESHDEPEADCTCGFHAFFDLGQALRLWRVLRDGVLLEVEGYGRIVVHTEGFRSARQEVLRVHLSPRCTWCLRDTAGLAYSAGPGAWAASCATCGSRWRRRFLSLPELRDLWQTEVEIWSKGTRLRPRSLRRSRDLPQ